MINIPGGNGGEVNHTAMVETDTAANIANLLGVDSKKYV